MTIDVGRVTKWFPLLFLALWSSGFVALKIGLEYADPLTFLAARYFVVLVLLAPAALWIGNVLPQTRRGWIVSAAVGLFLQAGYFGFTYLSLKSGLSAGAIAIITSQQPILMGLLAPAFTGERVTVIRWTGLILGVGGSVLVIMSSSAAEMSSPIGVAFGLLALLSMVTSALLEKRLGGSVHPVGSSVIQYTVGLAVIAPLAFLLEPVRLEWTWPLIGSLGYLVIGNSLLAIWLLLYMLRSGEATRVSALFFLVPPATAFLAFVVLSEPLTPLALVGMMISALAILIVTTRN